MDEIPPHRVVSDMDVSLKGLSQEDCVALGIGSLRSHLHDLLNYLEAQGTTTMTVHGFREYLNTLNVKMNGE